MTEDRTKIRSWIGHSRYLPQPERLEKLVTLDKLLESLELSAYVPIVDLSASAESCGESPEVLLSLCSIYRLSRLLIPAFEVIVIEGRSLLVLESTDALSSACTRVVFDQAMSYTRLLQQLFASDLDVTRLWPFTGLASFFVGHILLVFSPLQAHLDDWDSPLTYREAMHAAMLESDEFSGTLVDVPGPDSEEIKTHQAVLGILSIYWRPLRTLVRSRIIQRTVTLRDLNFSLIAKGNDPQ